MATVTIIGAGAMGSALVVPLYDNGNEVRLWGTELDGHIIDAVKAGKEHPKHKHILPNVKFYYEQELAQAMEGTTHVIMAITSDALGMVFERVVPYLKKGTIVATVSKGFNYNKDGKIVLLPEILEERIPESLQDISIVAIGGPCKANEVVYRSPSNLVYACKDIEAAQNFKQLIQTDVYNVKVDTDIVGVEVAVAMKNAYAIALGFAEGFKEREGYTHNNTKSALFAVALQEMIELSDALGGEMRSVIGLPGAGDLEVTGEAGRNRILGETIGGGMNSKDAIKKMADEDITVEGYGAVDFGYKLSQELIKEGKLKSELPLLSALYDILYGDAECYETIKNVLNNY